MLLVGKPRARDAEIGDLDHPLERQEHVLGGHVAMDNLEGSASLVALFVGVVQALGRLGDDPRARPGR